jgi:hypothetical protein
MKASWEVAADLDSKNTSAAAVSRQCEKSPQPCEGKKNARLSQSRIWERCCMP